MVFSLKRSHQQQRQKNSPQPGSLKSALFGLNPRAQQPQPYLAHARVSMADLYHHRERGQSQLKAEEKGMNWSECTCGILQIFFLGTPLEGVFKELVQPTCLTN